MSRAAAVSIVLAAVNVLLSPRAAAQRPVDLQRALDKPVELDVPDAPIDAVFQRLTDATGVPFVIGQDVYDSLPYGDQTRLAVKLKNVTVRNALSPMLAPQAMEWIIDRSAVRVSAAPALLRMGRRATYEELRLLGKVHSARLQPTARTAGIAPLDQLRKAAGNKDLSLVFRVEADEAAALKRAERVLPATAAEWLDMLCHGQDWTWYLWGDDLLIVDKKMQVRRQLQRQVSLKYEEAKLITVLLDLARQGRVKLGMDPGVLDYVPAETRTNFNLVMAEATIEQALEVISGATGLVFMRDPDGLRVEASERLKLHAAARHGSARTQTPFFLKKTLALPDGSTIELLIRPDDLPDDVKEAIKAQRDQLFKLLIRKYGATTRPATTQPSR